MKLNNLFKYFSFYTLILGFFLFSSVNILWAANEKKINVKIACVAFYNQENLFDTIDNENVNDYEFTPDGPNRWNSMKYKSKIEKMSYAISQIGLDVTPDGAAIVGVSEIENRLVLEDLVNQPALKKRSYEIVHYDGPDRRGVDVALLYNPKYFIVTNSKSCRLHTADTTFRTRDQLMVSGYLFGEKIHVIVNHWPSRSGGEMRSRPKRNAAAALTRSIVDSLYQVDKNAKIIIMGDLNDDPFNESVAKILGAKKNASDVKETDLYNPFWKILDRGIGSLAYNDQWNLFDQIIISAPLLNAPPSELKFWKAEVFNRDFLIQQEGRYKGNPWRSFAGGVWLNGFSDHFPTMIYLIKEADSQANEN